MEQRLIRVFRLFLLSFLGFLILIPPGYLSYAQDSTEKKVLILNSYHRGYKWTDDIAEGIESVLKAGDENVTLYIEYMDTKRSSDEHCINLLHEIYRHKFRDVSFDVIISSDDDAFNFLRKHREEIFPGTPTVFCGVNFFKESDLEGHDLFTGVNEEAYLKAGIEIALRLHPDTKRIIVINDTTTTGMKIHERLMEIIPDYRGSVKFVLLEDIEMERIQQRVQGLTPDNLVFFTTFFRDKSGRFFEYDESISLIAKGCNVPIYGAWDLNLGYGIVGGMLTSGYYQGEAAAKIALRILQGEDVRDIPVIKESPNRYMFDYNQLDRFDIRASDLPKGSIVINKPYSFYSRHKSLVWGVIASIAGLTLIILILSINIFKRRQAEERLKEAHDKLEERVIERTKGLDMANKQLNLELTERKRAEEELKQSEERYRLLFENAGSAIVYFDTEGKCVSVNRWVIDSLGGRDITGKSIYDILPKEVADFHIQRFTKIMKEGKGGRFEDAFELPGGKRWFSSDIQLVIDEIGNTRGVQIISDDITERKQSEEALRQSENHYRSVVEGSIQGIVIAHARDSTIQFANQAVAEMFGYTSPDELVGKSLWETLVEPEEWPELQGREATLLSGKTIPIHPGWRGIRKDGTRIWIQTTASLISWQGQPAVLGFYVDATERKQAEETLAEERSLLRTVIDNLPDYIYVKDTESRYVVCNNAHVRFLGATKPDEVIGKTVYDLFPQELAEQYYANDQGLIQSGQPLLNREEHSLNEKGKGVWNLTSKLPLRDSSGKIVGLVGIARDVTERVKAQEALRESEEKFRTFMETASDLMHIADKDGNFTYVNESMARTLGYSKEEMIGMHITQILGKEALKEFKPRSKELNTKGEISVEPAWVTKNGKEIYGELKIVAIYDSDSKFAGSRGVFHDLTERKRTEEALKESEERYRTLVENVPIAVYRTVPGPKGRFLMANPTFLKMFGLDSEEEFKRISVADVYMNPKDRKPFSGNLLSKGSVNGVELPLKKKDGTPFWGSVSARVVHDESGKTPRFDCTIIDITAQKKAEEEREKLQAQLQRAQKMEALGTLAGGVAHDLNNILAGLVSYPELLLMEIPEDSPLRKPILTIKNSGERAATIVQDLLTLARRGVSTMQVVNLNDIISEYLKSPEHEKLRLFHPDLQLETNFEEDLLNILGSPVHLSKTVMNLISNAAEAMPGGGKISISTKNRYIDRRIRGYDNVDEGAYITLTVSDTGVGISPEDMERMFEPFYTKKVMGRSGTGLGMAVVWGTIKDHRGYIDVKSAKGKGTTFTLYFPVSREELAKEKPGLSLEDYMGKGESVLVVDDVEEQRDIASRILRRLGYSARTVSSGEEAVDYMKGNSVDLLLLDMIMEPGIDGYETYKRILELHPEQKAIIVSGFSETERVKDTQRLGAGAYVKKPYLLEKIGIAIRGELDK